LNAKRHQAGLVLIAVILALGAGFSWAAMRTPQASPQGTLSEATRNKVLAYVRERFSVPDNVKLILGAPHASAIAPGFNELPITADDGKNQRTQPVLVSKDSHYLIVEGNVLDLKENSPAEMVQRVREVYKTPADTKLTIGGFKPSVVPDFQQGTLTAESAKAPKHDNPVLLTRDGKHLLLSEIFNLNVDLRAQALRTISLQDEPTQGPPTAPVTIVEYADLECPTCARLHAFFESQLLPRYGNKIRVVFKEFPLPMHDWSMTAAVACQCAYELNPAAYVPMRTAIFRDQQLINVANVREMVLNYGEQAGLDRVKLAGCVDAKGSYPRIQRDMAEAKRIEINQTPTAYINGRLMIGLPSEDAYFQAIDTALRGGK
jgi:protein-disulfide isomerase